MPQDGAADSPPDQQDEGESPILKSRPSNRKLTTTTDQESVPSVETQRGQGIVQYSPPSSQVPDSPAGRPLTSHIEPTYKSYTSDRSGIPLFALESHPTTAASFSRAPTSLDVSQLTESAPIYSWSNTYPPSWSASVGVLENSQADNVTSQRKVRSSKGQSATTTNTSRSYRSWDHARWDGLMEEACLVQWMAELPNWRDWRDARMKPQRERMVARLNQYFKNAGFQERTKESYINKIKKIEKSFKKALRWVYSTGSGAYSRTTVEGDEKSLYQQELDKICPYYDQLFAAMKERADIIPARVWSTVEEEADRQSDEFLRQLLLDPPRSRDSPDSSSQLESPPQDHDSPGRSSAYTQHTMQPARGRRRSQGVKRPRSPSADDVLVRFLDTQADAEDRRLRLEERRWRVERLKIRAETIATYMRGGMTSEEALKAYKDAKAEESSSSHERSEIDE